MAPKRQQQKGAAQSRSEGESSEEARSLKEREYRDEQGNIRHHTKTYMEQHAGEQKGEKSQKGQSEKK